jgi:quinoprotein glucose dehydrogenase
MTLSRRPGGVCAAAALVAALVVQGAATGTADGQWRVYSGDNAATKYSPLDQINSANVRTLKVAWRRPQIPGDISLSTALRPNNNFRSTPIMVNGVLYASNGIGLAEAIDPATGATIWVQKPGLDPLRGSASLRGLAHWTDGKAHRIFSYRNQYLYALDARTGEEIASFGSGGRVDLSAGLDPRARGWRWNGAPLIVRDLVIIGSAMTEQDFATRMEGPPGVVRAFDVRTGALRWTWNPIPQAGEPGVETWENDSWMYSGAANVWSLMSADEELGYIYLPTTSATSDYYGGHRLGDNLYSTSVVCLDATTGKRIWHFQTVHHDIFDYDNPAAPILADVTVDGRRVRAVVQVTKQAFAYVFDRITGKPVWPMQERPVPPSTVPGERASRTQPFPTKPPAFDRQGISEDDLIDFTPELRAEALEIARKYVLGPMFTPGSLPGPGPDDRQGTIQLPGTVGGADWTGAAFDPETGRLYVPSMTGPIAQNMMPGNPETSNLRYRVSTNTRIVGPRGLPLVKPPYGRITALDLNRGEKVWTVANGDGPRRHPAIAHLKLGPLGNASRSAVIATSTLLFATVGDQINVGTPPGFGGRQFSAFDKRTGELLWTTELEAGATGAPMTYLHRGKQYVVFAIGSQQHAAEFVAFALP